MKIVLFVAACSLLACLTRSQAQASPPKFTGDAIVDGLGTVTFPGGEWSLEFQRLHQPESDNRNQPDYFVFKKLGGQLERLTFLRHRPTSPPRQLQFFLDGIGETMGDGIPNEEKNKYGGKGGLIYPMRLVPQTPKETDRSISFSFIHVNPPSEPTWLCHTILFLHDSSVFVIAHASTSAIDPNVVQDVQAHSRFSTTAPTQKSK